MKIKELDIRDIGIIQGQRLENLGDGLVVIGGMNRAGKTTFMDVLRHIGYGFNKSSKIPPPKFEYDVRSRFVLENDELVDVLLKGYSKPEVKIGNGNNSITIDEIYNCLDNFSYKQLFTISLDELQKISDKDEGKMQSVLLGAGLNDIVKIPRIVEEMKKEAYKIGGKKGTPSTKMFKPYNENITRGIELKKDALKNITVFKDKKQQLEKTEKLINKKIICIDNIDNEIIIMDVLKNNYDLYYEMKELNNQYKNYDYDEGIKYNNADLKGEELYRDYKELLASYTEKIVKFKSTVSDDLYVREILLKYKHQIESCSSQISGLKEKIKNLYELNDELNKNELNIKNKMKSINENWNSVEQISEMNVSEIDNSILINLVMKYNDLIVDKKEYEKAVETLSLDKNILEGELKEYKSISNSNFLKKYLYILIIFILGGAAVFYFEKLLGIAIIIAGAVGTGLYLFIKYNSSAAYVSRCSKNNIKLKQIKKALSEKEEKLKNIVNDINIADEEFDAYREMLQLDINVSPEGIKNYYSYVKSIKEDIAVFEGCKNKLKMLYGEINNELKDFDEIINFYSIISGKNFDSRNPIKNYKEIFLASDDLQKYLKCAEELNIAEQSKNLLEERIKKVLNIDFEPNEYIETVQDYMMKGKEYKSFIHIKQKCDLIKEKIQQVLKTERVNRALEQILQSSDQNIYYFEQKMNRLSEEDNSKYDQEENTIELKSKINLTTEKLISILQEIYEKYASLEEIQQKYAELSELKNKWKNELDSLKDQRQTLKYEINELSTDKALESAHKLIQDNRASLKPLAQKYAVYSTAALILEKLQKNFMNNCKESLLSGAGKILSDITSGEISEIQPMEDLSQCDFKTVMNSGGVLEKSNMLSRGTKEQLFLSVRLSRIKEIKPALPVIFDDSFVNFDLKHTKKVIELLSDLSRTHQVFVLTCHPQLVKLISDVNNKSQYWKIESGKFELSNSEKLMDYLQR